MSVECSAVVMRGFKVSAEEVAALYDNHGVEWNEARNNENLIAMDEYANDTCDWVLGEIIASTEDMTELNIAEFVYNAALNWRIREMPGKYKLPVKGEMKDYLICRWN